MIYRHLHTPVVHKYDTILYAGLLCEMDMGLRHANFYRGKPRLTKQSGRIYCSVVHTVKPIAGVYDIWGSRNKQAFP